MERRIYYGVDLNVNFADLLGKASNATEYKQLVTRREFKLGCLARERNYFSVGNVVVDRESQGWVIDKIEGKKIEEMLLHVSDRDGDYAVFDAIDVVRLEEVELDSQFIALKFAILAAVGMDEEAPQLRSPHWFDIVDQVKQMERDSWEHKEPDGGGMMSVQVFVSRYTPGLKNGKGVKFEIGETVRYRMRNGHETDITIDSDLCSNMGYLGYEAIFHDDGGKCFAVDEGIVDWEGKR